MTHVQYGPGEKLVENYIDVFFRGGSGSPAAKADASRSHRQDRLKKATPRSKIHNSAQSEVPGETSPLTRVIAALGLSDFRLG